MRMQDFLVNLRNYGFSPKNILDIGAHHGNWSRIAKGIFREAAITMVEPIQYDNPSMSFGTMRRCLLDENVREVDWYERRNTGDSIYKERTKHFENCIPIKRETTTLDIEFGGYFDSSPELIKIDTQGAEIPILKGGVKTIKDTEVIILEMPFFGQMNENVGSFSEHIYYMDSIGYTPMDIIEIHKGLEFARQVDIGFIKKGHKMCLDFQEKINNMGSDSK